MSDNIEIPSDRPWQDEAVLQELRGERGINVKDIAEKLDVSKRTVHKYLSEYDIEPPWRDPERLKQLHYEEELTYPEMGERMNCSRDTIAREMKKHDLGRGRGSMSYRLRTDYAHYGSDNQGYPRWTDTTDHSSVQVHRLLAVAKYGFDAVRGMDVHHMNHCKWDNRPENIELMTRSEHRSYHNNHRYGNETLTENAKIE